MEVREYVYTQLQAQAPLMDLVHGQLLAHSSFSVVPELKPFITYRLMVGRSEFRMPSLGRQDIQFAVHDEMGDYLVIDSIIRGLKLAMMAIPPEGSSGFIEASPVEDSDDLVDPVYLTSYKTTRYQIALGKVG